MSKKTLPKDPVILLSYINTQLRDHYSSLAELCEDMEIEEQSITNILSSIQYHYDKKLNRFL